MRRRKRSAIVPALVLGASFAAVVPAVACSGPGTDPITNLRRDLNYGVAAVAYCCFEGGGVADVAFKPDAADAEASTDAPDDVPGETGDARDGG